MLVRVLGVVANYRDVGVGSLLTTMCGVALVVVQGRLPGCGTSAEAAHVASKNCGCLLDTVSVGSPMAFPEGCGRCCASIDDVDLCGSMAPCCGRSGNMKIHSCTSRPALPTVRIRGKVHCITCVAVHDRVLVTAVDFVLYNRYARVYHSTVTGSNGKKQQRYYQVRCATSVDGSWGAT